MTHSLSLEVFHMDFNTPEDIGGDVETFGRFLLTHLKPHLSLWYKGGKVLVEFYRQMGGSGWLGIQWKDGGLVKTSSLREALINVELAKLSPGVAIAVLAHVNLGLIGLYLFGSDQLKQRYGRQAARGETLMCLGTTENKAGSDVAGISMTAEKAKGGWRLSGTKAYVTNGYIADLGVITAVSDPEATRNRRLSMFLVELNSPNIKRTKLNKQVWIPSDLTRLQFSDVFVPTTTFWASAGEDFSRCLRCLPGAVYRSAPRPWERRSAPSKWRWTGPENGRFLEKRLLNFKPRHSSSPISTPEWRPRALYS